MKKTVDSGDEKNLKQQTRNCQRCSESEGKKPISQLNRPGGRYEEGQEKPFQYPRQ